MNEWNHTSLDRCRLLKAMNSTSLFFHLKKTTKKPFFFLFLKLFENSHSMKKQRISGKYFIG